MNIHEYIARNRYSNARDILRFPDANRITETHCRYRARCFRSAKKRVLLEQKCQWLRPTLFIHQTAKTYDTRSRTSYRNSSSLTLARSSELNHFLFAVTSLRNRCNEILRNTRNISSSCALLSRASTSTSWVSTLLSNHRIVARNVRLLIKNVRTKTQRGASLGWKVSERRRAGETAWLDELHRRGISAVPERAGQSLGRRVTSSRKRAARRHARSPSRRRKHCRRQRAPRRRSIKRIPQSAKTFTDILLYPGAPSLPQPPRGSC